MPRGERDAWLFTVSYASDEEIFHLAHGIPIPRIAYLCVPNDTFKAVIGFPFTSVEYKPLKALILGASYFPVRTVPARATYVLFPPLRVFLGFDADHDN